MSSVNDEGTTMGLDEISSPEVEFINEVITEFTYAINAAILDDVPDTHPRSRKRLGGIMTYLLDDVQAWLNSVLRNSKSWDFNVLFINALREGMKTGTIVFESTDDMEAMLFVLKGEAWLKFSSHIVRYYVGTGEFMELMHLLREELRTKTYQPGAVYEDPFARFRAKMFRIHAYDTTQDREAAALGEDRVAADVPLEIRLNFSGFHDAELSKKELEQEKTHLRVLRRLATKQYRSRFSPSEQRRMEEAEDGVYSSAAKMTRTSQMTETGRS